MLSPLFIAEVKTHSPFGFKSEHNFYTLLDLAIEHGDIIAVHTDERWGGGFGNLEVAAKILDKVGYPERKHPDREKPLLLAKGIHEADDEIRDCLSCGADLVLVVNRLPPRELAPVCIWEPRTIDDLQEGGVPSQMTMWNERDLTTGANKRAGSIREAREIHQGWLCQASFIRTPADVGTGVDAFIVGEHLPSFVESMALC